MSLDLSKVGYQTQSHEFKYDWKATVLYALGIGATGHELDYLYEGRGPKVFPTFAVVPAYAPVAQLLEVGGGDIRSVVHTAQSVRIHRPFPPAGLLETVGEIHGIYDLKRMAVVDLATRSRCDGELVCETRWRIVYRGMGRFGGSPPPKLEPPKLPEGTEPSFVHEQRTVDEQALLYRLSGDHNPLHADPDFAAAAGFERGPILHGLCTFGLLARAAILHACNGDGDRISVFEGQFKRPIWPGQTLVIRGYELGEGRLVLRAHTTEEPNLPVAVGWTKSALEVTPES